MKILFAVDGSECARVALDALIARAAGGTKPHGPRSGLVGDPA